VSRDWKQVTLGEICSFKYGEMPKKTDLVDEGYPVFSGYRVVGNSSRYHYRYPEIVVVARGVGGTGDIKMSPAFCFLTNLSIAVLVQSPAVDKKFLYYQLTSTTLWGLRTGSAQAQITIERLKGYDVKIPPLPIQRRIAGILSAYDELIENDQRRIRILEEMARALYREWFVNFRFPGHQKVPLVASALGDIPQSWEVGRLDDVLVLQRGFDLPKADRVEGTIPIYAATGVTGFHSEAKVKSPGVVTGRSGTIGDVVYVQEDFWPLNTVLWVKEFPKAEPLYAYYVLSSLDLKQFNSGAAVPTLNRNDIHGFDTLIPPRPLQKRFQEIAGAMHTQTRILELQIQNLRRTRDLMLPRLLSGQVELPETEAAA
jgi:type I restriction enzyme, S subunit